MPKAKKLDSHVAAKVAPPVVSSTNVESASKKSVKSVKKPADVVVEPVAKVVSALSVSTPQEEASGDTLDPFMSDTFSEFMSKLQALTQHLNILKSEFRLLEKKAVRELKAAQKIQAKRKRKTGNRQPSGFVKPTLISDELASFLKKPTGTEMARTEVTREINGYIRAHSLQDKQNGRKIIPDLHLAKLLKIGDGEELTYFNLQRYMSPHFAKATPKVVVTSVLTS